ncbi:ATP-binding protein [Variovorax sp. VNK109]|uniref:ATP-binding protein n=1 Tax=Variovorax sp. VNK109 TaxID=3400919 RepID=UPI003C03BF7D
MTSREPLDPGPEGTHSLRGRLLLFLLLAIALCAVLQAVGAYRGAIRQADEMFDFHLRQMAHSLRSGMPPPMWPPGPQFDDDIDFEVQIWGPDGAQLFRSPRSELPQSAVLGFSDVNVEGTSYRVYTVQTPIQTVQIAQDRSARNARARALAAHAVLPAALMAPLLMLVVWWVVSSSLVPLRRTQGQVASRAANDFSPLQETGLPDEVRPLVNELNLLFARVRTAFETQKNFVADAAHELRSPLTALKLQAQALRQDDLDTAGREQAIARLNQGIDRTIHLVEQLLALARAEADAPARDAKTPGNVAELHDVARLAVSDVLPRAQASGIDLGLVEDGGRPKGAGLRVRGDTESLRTLLRNLLDNAVKYTPAPGRVDVSLSPQADGSIHLVVEDSGPGIPEAERERVFDRFARGHGVQATQASGSGLGLAIARAVAERHGATLALGHSERLGGLRVTCRFPSLTLPVAAGSGLSPT